MFLNTATKEARSTLFLVFEFTLVLEFPQTKKKKSFRGFKKTQILQYKFTIAKEIFFFFLVNNNIY